RPAPPPTDVKAPPTEKPPPPARDREGERHAPRECGCRSAGDLGGAAAVLVVAGAVARVRRRRATGAGGT
ncbi:MAG TPA: MYXO-CTERM sorting domain-containing protein, partial [Kofleriaceae bacterium]|nr:MYXO-CTERM sorting domain-containing protein [Kofleriaceae bacterium]